MEAAAAKRLRAKEEEIQRMGRLNWELEERVKSLYIEAQVWRDLAQSNEAAANVLRGELQQALDAQQARLCSISAGGADDAESCCCGENDVAAGAGARAAGAKDGETSSPGNGRRACAVCSEGAAEVLLLPCRHLCCRAATCAADAARACPACGCAKNGTVCVNFSAQARERRRAGMQGGRWLARSRTVRRRRIDCWRRVLWRRAVLAWEDEGRRGVRRW